MSFAAPMRGEAHVKREHSIHLATKDECASNTIKVAHHSAGTHL